jgi:hypothetical protein
MLHLSEDLFETLWNCVADWNVQVKNNEVAITKILDRGDNLVQRE